MDLDYINSYMDAKIAENHEIIIFSFFELRIKENLSECDLNNFLNLSKIRLENLGYSVYFTGESYKYNNEFKVVQDNELMIAIEILNNTKRRKFYTSV